MSKITQKQWVINQILKNGHITRNECLKVYITRLSSIINKLEKVGFKFDADYFKVETIFGNNAKDYKYTCTYIPEEYLNDGNNEVVKLSDFLQENNCYDKFIKNFDKEWDWCDAWLSIDDYSIYAFNWNESPEGTEFWSNLDYKWYNIKNKENDMIEIIENL